VTTASPLDLRNSWLVQRLHQGICQEKPWRIQSTQIKTTHRRFQLPSNLHDRITARTLKRSDDAKVSYEVAVADAGYDARTNYFATIRHKAKPVIAYNRRRKPKGTTERRLDRTLPIKRNSPEWKRYYTLRGAVERQFSELKQQLGMNDLTLRGMERVTIHLSISLIVLLAINLVAHLTGNPELLRSFEPWRYLDA
jgi:hypothetical protein